MKLSLDSSSFAKRYIQEEGSDRLDGLLRDASDLALCVISLPELISSLNRRLREGALTVGAYRKIKSQLLDDVHDATILQISPAVLSLTIKLLENNLLRAMDALHVASALLWKADLFVTSDRRQLQAAIASGLRTEYLGKPDA